MNYYQFPDVLDGVAINWDLTQVETATNTNNEVFKLIQVVNVGVETTEDGGSNIDKANAFFTRNNYATTIMKSANVLEEHIKNELKVNKPVFIGGMPSTGSIGHAFVCDGYIEYIRNNKLVSYELTRTDNSSFTESPYIKGFNKAKDTSYECYFHMNWGWGILYKDNTSPAYRGGNTTGWFRSIFETEYPKDIQILKVYPKW